MKATHFIVKDNEVILYTQLGLELPEALSDAIKITEQNWPHDEIVVGSEAVLVPRELKAPVWVRDVDEESGEDFGYAQEDQAALMLSTQKQLEAAVQAHLDSKVGEKNYANIVSACSYATSTGSFGAEGQACVEWRDAVWTKCYEILNDVMAGNRAVPTEEELLAELPELVW